MELYKDSVYDTGDELCGGVEKAKLQCKDKYFLL